MVVAVIALEKVAMVQSTMQPVVEELRQSNVRQEDDEEAHHVDNGEVGKVRHIFPAGVKDERGHDKHVIPGDEESNQSQRARNCNECNDKAMHLQTIT